MYSNHTFLLHVPEMHNGINIVILCISAGNMNIYVYCLFLSFFSKSYYLLVMKAPVVSYHDYISVSKTKDVI